MKIFVIISAVFLVFAACSSNTTEVKTDKNAVPDEAANDNIAATDDVSDTVTGDNLLVDEDTVVVPGCGNGVIEAGEACDKDTKACVEISDRYISGDATCKTDCSGYDRTKCVRGCTDGQLRCTVNMLQECTSNTWNDIQDCSETGLKCFGALSQGQTAECRELGDNITCLEVMQCANTCAGAEACLTECKEAGAPSAIPLYDALAKCAAEKCAGQTGNQCLYQNCQSELMGCRDDVGIKCGNGFIEEGEDCDDGNMSALDGCSADCKTEPAGTCGNNVIESKEQCDDGGTGNGDGCSSTCLIEYGDRFDFTGPEYTGDTILAINTSPFGSMFSHTGTLPATLVTMSTPAKTNVQDIPGLFNNPHFTVPFGITREDLYQPEINLLPAIGDTASFYVANDSGQATQKTATLMKISEHVQIWATETDFATEDEINAIADEFDTVIYPLVTENFYEPSDVNGDGTISLLFTDLGSFIAGYFSPGDLYSKSAYPQSNQRDIIFVSTKNALNKAGAYAVITHEFQHLTYNNRNSVVEGDAELINDLDNLWINEGLSMSAMHLYNGVQTSWISAYNAAVAIAAGQSLTFWEYNDNTKVYGNYALSYLFFHYLYIQSGKKAGIYRELSEDTLNDYRCVENVIRKYVKPGLSMSDFLINFKLALLLNENTGTFGFGETNFDLDPRYYTGTGENLRGAGGLFFQTSGSFTEPSDKGPMTRFVGIKTK